MTNDFAQNVDLLAQDMRWFMLSPVRWKQSRVTVPLSWVGVRFEATNRTQVPDASGIYCFIVRHENDHFPPHSYLMYIGITGAHNRTRTLRNRFSDYIREQTHNKRPRIHYMLTKYAHDLFFYFVAVDGNNIPLEQLEADLNDALVPPCVTNDFSAEVRRHVRALP